MDNTTKVQMGADELLQAVTSNDLSYALAKVNEFKAAVKRLFVDIPQVPRYFEALTIAFKSRDTSVSQTSFSAICHLIRRVSDQDPSPLASVHYLVLPVVVSELASDKSYIKSAAKKALLSFWEVSGQLVQNYVRDKGLEHENPKVRSELLLILYDIIAPGFSFKLYLKKVVLLLDDENLEVSRNATNLLIKFFTEIVPYNKTARNDLINDLREFNITKNNALNLLNSIDTDLADKYLNVPVPEHLNTLFDPMNSFVSAGSIRVTAGKNAVGYTGEKTGHDKPRSKPIYATENRSQGTLKSNPPSRRVSQPQSTQTETTPVDFYNVNEEIPNILEETPCFELDDISPIDINSESELLHDLDNLLSPFTDKETEFNWNKREKVIIRLRGLLRGNCQTEYSSAFCQILKPLKEGICKAISSLRTTLSSHGCQLVKEIGIFLNSALDAHIAEYFIQPLIKLTVARKSICHQNAHVGVCALLVYCTFTPKILNYVYESSVNKNVQPRAYCGIWIHLLLLRFKDNITAIESMEALEVFTKALVKGISDPTPAVRESMRSAYWTLRSISPSHGDKILSKLDASTVKALERSRGGNSTSNKSSRKPSVRELIISKQREQRTSSSNSSRSSSAGSKTESKQFSRAASRDFSGNSATSHLTKTRLSSNNTASYHEYRNPSQTTLDYSDAIRKNNEVQEDNTAYRYREALPEQFSETGDISIGEDNYSDKEASQELNDPVKHDTASIKWSPKDAVTEQQTLSQNPVTTVNDIFGLLSSTDKSEQRRGIDLLKEELLIDNSELPGKFRSVLDSLSLTSPQLFSGVLLSDVGDKLAQYLSTDNFVRLVCGVLSSQIDKNDQPEFARKICKILSTDDICISISNVVSSSTDTSTIDSRDLTVLYMLNKQIYVSSCIILARTCLMSLELEDYLFSTLLEPFLKFWVLRVSDDEEEAEDFMTLMKLFYTKDSHIFSRCFNDVPESHSKHVLSVALGMSSPVRSHNDNSSIYNISENETDGDPDAGMLDDEMDAANGITMVVHQNIPRNLEASKSFSSDMTMIVPKFNRNNTTSLKFDAASKSEQESNPFRVTAGRPVSRISEGEEVLDESSNTDRRLSQVNEPVASITKTDHDLSIDDDNSNMDVDGYVSAEDNDQVVSDPDLNRLSITEQNNLSHELKEERRSSPRGKEADSLVDLTDPLASITSTKASGSRTIDIFQDPVGESQDPGKLDILKDNWFSFELKKYKASGKFEVINPDDFVILNEKLSQKRIDEVEFVKLINLTENALTTNHDFEKLQANVLNYLSHDIKRNYALHCISLLRICILKLGSTDEIVVKDIWNKCISICSVIEDADDELFYGLIEVIELVNSKAKILEYSIDSLIKINKLQSMESKYLKIFTLSVIFSSFGDYITYEQVYSLDNALMKNIKSSETTIRRLTILNFSKLYELSLDNSKDLVAPVLFDKLDSTQLELVRYYTAST